MIQVQAIHSAYPHLCIETVRPFGDEGQFNNLLIVNERLIFRFPKYVHGIETLRRETYILKRIRGRTTLPVPNPIFSHFDPPILGQVFMGYPRLPGEPLFREILQLIEDETTLERLAQQLANFMLELHHIPIELFGQRLPGEDGLQEWQDLYQAVRADLFRFIPPEDQAWTCQHFERFIQDENLHRYTPCLRHDDFGSSNILYDRQSGRITGVIDFGFAGLGDPALDLAAISTFGPAFFARICRYYPGSDEMLPRARFYRGTYALQEALHGYRNGDLEAFERGLAV